MFQKYESQKCSNYTWKVSRCDYFLTYPAFSYPFQPLFVSSNLRGHRKKKSQYLSIKITQTLFLSLLTISIFTHFKLPSETQSIKKKTILSVYNLVLNYPIKFQKVTNGNGQFISPIT